MNDLLPWRTAMPRLRRLLWLLVLVPLALPPAVLAGEEEAPRVRQRVIRVEKEPEVVFIEGPDGFHGFRGGYLGVGLLDLTKELREHFGAPAEAGVMVSSVEPDGPAAKAGVEVGDILTAVDGEALRSSWDLGRRIRRGEEGDSVSLELVRAGKSRTLTATLDERDRRMVDIAPLVRGRVPGTPGMEEGMFDMEVLGPGMEKLHRMLDDPAHRDHLRLLREREGELQQKLEQRLKEMEKRLQELEKQLGEKN
jgi:hypothetical protein